MFLFLLFSVTIFGQADGSGRDDVGSRRPHGVTGYERADRNQGTAGRGIGERKWPYRRRRVDAGKIALGPGTVRPAARRPRTDERTQTTADHLVQNVPVQESAVFATNHWRNCSTVRNQHGGHR